MRVVLGRRSEDDVSRTDGSARPRARFRGEDRNYRAAGTVAKVNLALVRAAGVRRSPPRVLSGRIHIGPTWTISSARSTTRNTARSPDEPWLDITIPSILDPALAPRAHTSCRSTCTTRRIVRARRLGAAKECPPAPGSDTLERAPGIGALVAAAGHHARELERRIRFPADMLHGELALDQLFTMRPLLLGHARYARPRSRACYLCGAGTHPAVVHDGRQRKAGRAPGDGV